MDNSRTLLLLFKSEWCSTCKKVAPVAEEVARSYPDKVELKEIDITKEPDMATKYEVLSVPTLIVVKEEKVIEKINGFVSKDALIKKLGL